MGNNQCRINFYKQFDLVDPLCGLVSKITSPKGIRKEFDDGKFSYQFRSSLVGIYEGEEMLLEPGLYWVMDVCKPKKYIIWCHYLFIIGKDGICYPVAEFLNQKNTDWVKRALPLVKDYFNGAKLTKITVTNIRPKTSHN